MRVLTVVGIRPDFIRMSQIIGLLDQSTATHVMAHTGQHYSYQVDGVFFDELGIRRPDYQLSVGSGSHAEQVGRLLLEVEKLLPAVRPDLFVVLGDSTTSLAAIQAVKSNVRVAHIEAGMRSYDWRMPEEKNRTIVDHISDYLYVYTPRYRENLLAEGIAPQKIVVTGNPIVDVVKAYLPRALERKRILETLGLTSGQYVLVTAHRAENVDSRKTLAAILQGLEGVARALRVPVVFPVYYRTQQRLRQLKIAMPAGIRMLEPLGFLEFLCLEAHALCLITDSGTVQEEGCILKVPCVTIRLSTERPETVEVGANDLSGVDPERIVESTLRMVKVGRTWANPLGDGMASARIVEDILRRQKAIEDKTISLPLDDPRKKVSFAGHLGPGERVELRPIWDLDTVEGEG